MNEHWIREMLEGGGGAGGGTLRALLYVPGKVYGLVMRARRALYEWGILPSAAASVPVISVGNITAGGSGKTPMTAFLANHFLSAGKKPAILLRGYRAAEGAASDEAVLYADICPGALVEVGGDRVASAARAVAAGAEVLLMDDGFQHLRLRRGLDIVLIDATAPWGGGNCLPGGLLREPLSALARVRAVVITRADQVAAEELAALRACVEARAPVAAVFTACHRPVRLREVGGGGGASLSPERLRGREVVVLSGIARPEAFAKTLSSLGAVVVASFTENDHRAFSEETVRGAFGRGAPVVTTEKDWARGIVVPASGAPLWVLGVALEVEGGERLLEVADENVSLTSIQQRA